jgi:hypothetical protein
LRTIRVSGQEEVPMRSRERALATEHDVPDETVVVEAPTEDYAAESADSERTYRGEYVQTTHTECRRLSTIVEDADE